MTEQQQQQENLPLPEGAKAVPIAEYMERYHESRAYYEWLGVTEKEFIGDCVKSFLANDASEFLAEEAKAELDAFDDKLRQKYDDPQVAFIESKGITWEQYEKMPEDLQRDLFMLDVIQVTDHGFGDFSITINRGKNEPIDKLMVKDTTVTLNKVEKLKKTLKKDVAKILGRHPKGVKFDEATLAELERSFIIWLHAIHAENRPLNLKLSWEVIGCFLGEVIIQNAGGEWLMDVNQGNKHYWEAAVKTGHTICFPFTKARKFIHSPYEESVYQFYKIAEGKTLS